MRRKRYTKIPELDQKAMTSFILPWLHSTSCQIFDQDMIDAELAGLDYPRVASFLYVCVCVCVCVCECSAKWSSHSHQTVPTGVSIHFSLGLYMPYFHILLRLL